MPTPPAADPALPVTLDLMGPDDFNALEDELDALRATEDETPQWEFCEGFLAALVCCRRPIAPAEYWPVLLGDAFNPMQHMEFVLRWHRRRVEVETALDAPVATMEDERTYQPEVLDIRGALLAEPEPANDLRPAGDEAGVAQDNAYLPAFAQVWALGFMFFVENWPDEWRPPRDRDAAQMLEDALGAIVTLTEDDEAPPALSMYEEDGPPSVSQQRMEDFGVAIWAVYDLRQLWHSLGPRVEPLRQAPKPGRNDPCPCGSGKKFKKCHGA